MLALKNPLFRLILHIELRHRDWCLLVRGLLELTPPHACVALPRHEAALGSVAEFPHRDFVARVLRTHFAIALPIHQQSLLSDWLLQSEPAWAMFFPLAPSCRALRLTRFQTDPSAAWCQ